MNIVEKSKQLEPSPVSVNQEESLITNCTGEQVKRLSCQCISWFASQLRRSRDGSLLERALAKRSPHAHRCSNTPASVVLCPLVLRHTRPYRLILSDTGRDRLITRDVRGPAPLQTLAALALVRQTLAARFDASARPANRVLTDHAPPC
jgi:hypothetical protein